MDGRLIDLHIHSRCSDDGEFTPDELVEQCRESGVKIMAIADHNCVRANAGGIEAAAAAEIIYIPAIEIDCTYEGVNLHVLGYGIDYESRDFDGIEENIRRQGRDASGKMLLATQKLGFHVTESDMEAVAEGSFWKDQWTGEMFAEVLLHKTEYQDHPLLKPYRRGAARGGNPYVNFYWDFYSQGKPCYTGIEYPDLEEIADIIHRNGGRAVLAHPGINLKNHTELLEPIVGTGIDGIEAFSSYHTPEQCRSFYAEARHLRKFVTCGSDYHGKTKPSIPIGGHGCTVFDEEMEGQLRELLGTLYSNV